MLKYHQILLTATLLLLLSACLAGSVFKWDFYELQETRKLAEKRQYAQYRSKAFFAAKPEKRLKYKAQAAGAKAFLKGGKSFHENGTPKAAPSI
jgi:hypothetical protein